MITPDAAPPKRRWHPWPVGIALAVLTGMAINIGMVVIARRNTPVMADKGDYYAHSLAWQTEIDAAKASATLGWQAAVTGEADAVWVRLRDASGTPVRGLMGQLSAERNDVEAHDFAVDLAEVAPGDYRALRPHRVGGLYRLRIRLAPAVNAGANAAAPVVPWLDERLLVLP